MEEQNEQEYNAQEEVQYQEPAQPAVQPEPHHQQETPAPVYEPPTEQSPGMIDEAQVRFSPILNLNSDDAKPRRHPSCHQSGRLSQ